MRARLFIFCASATTISQCLVALTGSGIENVSQVFGTFAMMFAKLLCTKRFQDLDFHAELHGTRDRSEGVGSPIEI